LATAQFGIFGGGAHEGLDRRGVQRIASSISAGNERRIGFDAIEQAGLRRERPHGAGGG
jgi:hypothetical protein